MKKRFLYAITAIVAIIFILTLLILAQFLHGTINNSMSNESNKTYLSQSTEECSRIRFVCQQGYQYFSDDLGCGCERIVGNNSLDENYCTPEQRGAEVCTLEFKSVCGWNDPSQIQCIRYPCAQTYGNSCSACADDKVLYWTDGECPA